MRTPPATHLRRSGGYALMECLVYIGLVTLVVGAAFIAAYRCIDNSAVLRRNAEDIAKALNVGEQWRADIRKASAPIRVLRDPDGLMLEIPAPEQARLYWFSHSTLLRRTGDGPWVPLLNNVKSTDFVADSRHGVSAWRWELELQPRIKGAVKAGRVRPLFTFIAAGKAT